MIRIGLYRFLTSCGAGVDASRVCKGTVRIATDIAEDFNLGGRGHRVPQRKHAIQSAAGKVKNLMS